MSSVSRTATAVNKTITRRLLSGRRRSFSTSSPQHAPPGIVYPGSGIFSWWQIGATRALGEKFDLSRAQFAGVSGGSLAATLAACEVDSDHAFAVAWRLCKNSGAFDTGSWGLFGICENCHLPTHTLVGACAYIANGEGFESTQPHMFESFDA
mmetsp:Transcript_10727/g.27540  ORF Transcript_10727/g.27540 Transcript_10727/m.27540 type:complete len:153 (+) Transcript_10727:54-512(+)